MSSSTFVEREFAGEVRRFQLPLPDTLKLYRGIESEGVGNISELAQRAAAGTLGTARVEHILAHALSRGHPLTLLRMRELVRAEMRDKPLSSLEGLAVSVLTASYVGAE